MRLKFLFIQFFLVLTLNVFAQNGPTGILAGNVVDENSKAISDVNVSLIPFEGTGVQTIITDKNGSFVFIEIQDGYYKLRFSYSGLQTLEIDSIFFRMERNDFNFYDVTLKAGQKNDLKEVIIYAEKPLVESKDGNITFNAGESALAAGSSLGEVLNHVPLITKDPDGKVLVRGKEPKILIDDKPVELNLQQLQDLLESMPGSSIEKIEVMTNPPPQFANEQGGVINIVTRKGKVGMGGRIALSAGTRREAGVNASFNYRKNKLAININAGAGFSRFGVNGNSTRKNLYADSVNYLNTVSNSVNQSMRPNFRLNVDYELKKYHQLNATFNYNVNDFNNQNDTRYINLNRFDQIYKLSERSIENEGLNFNNQLNVTYTIKSKNPGEQFRIILGAGNSKNNSDRLFYQEYFNPDFTPNGLDSTQKQDNTTKNTSFNYRISYDKPLGNKKTSFSLGTAYNRNNSHVKVDAAYKKKPEGVFYELELLSNHFRFQQDVTNFRASVKQILIEGLSISGGLAAEATKIRFDLLKENRELDHDYWNYLPFVSLNQTWKEKFAITLAYRRTIRRPGINELNPAIDFSDPYNIRFGNYKLTPTLTHDFNLVLSRTRKNLFLNFSAGYNIVEDVFSQIRTLQPDGKTQITWENISGRKEYELSTWNGYTISKKAKINLSSSYTYFKYGEFDRTVRKFRNGGSFSNNLNGNYIFSETMNVTGGFTINRFANPQGSVSWNLGMNTGIQKKLLQKKFIITFNIIDPFRNQVNNRFTYGERFEFRSYQETITRNFRLSLAYNFIKTPAKPVISNKAKG